MGFEKHHLVARAANLPENGLGHVVRSLALCQAWVRSGGRATLVVDDLGGPTAEIVPTTSAVDIVCATGLDAASEHEACLVVDPDVVSIDGYRFGQATVDALMDRGVRAVSIDDEWRGKRYRADLHVDQNAGASESATVTGRQVVGSSFVLLRQEFATSRISDCPPETTAERSGVVVALGGSGIGDNARAIGGLTSEALGRPVVTLSRTGHRTASPHDLFARAELAVVAAGSTVWELCSTRTPMVLVTLAENQVAIAEYLASEECAEYVGSIDEADPDDLTQRVRQLLTDSERQSELVTNAAALVDGRGADRVVAHIRSLDLDVRPATMDDAELLLAWRNDDSVRRWSFSSDPVGFADHVSWLSARLAEAEPLLFVGESQGEPIGQVRFSPFDDGLEIGVSLAESARGHRLAAPLILAGVHRAIDQVGPRRIVAQIKPDNGRSVAAFALAGFRSDGQPVGVDDALKMSWTPTMVGSVQ